MIELVFRKNEYCYHSYINLQGDDVVIELDTGSPITTISIPSLLQITGESLYAFQKKAEGFLAAYGSLSLGVYGSQMHDVSRQFLPYLVRNVTIGSATFPYFLFWVDITNINDKEIRPTSILFGFDYIRQGRKYFDENDDFHIVFDKIQADMFSVRHALSNINESTNDIDRLLLELDA